MLDPRGELRAAEAGVSSSAAQLSQAQNAVKTADIAAAEAALASAEANLKSVEIQYTRNPEPDDIQANTALAQAREQVAAAQARLDSLLAGPNANQVGSAQASLSAAAAQRDAAAAQLNGLSTGAAAAELAAARARVAQAEAALAELTRGPSSEETLAAEAEVEQARIGLADAEAALAAASIVAPFDGVVTAVMVNEGEFASGRVLDIVTGSHWRAPRFRMSE